MIGMKGNLKRFPNPFRQPFLAPTWQIEVKVAIDSLQYRLSPELLLDTSNPCRGFFAM